MAFRQRIKMLVSSILLLIPPVGHAAEAVDWPVKGKLFGKADKKSKDISGIACSTTAGFPRHCLVIDDNSQQAQSVILREGSIEAGPLIPLIETMFGEKRLELDGEGVAYADGLYYVIGSHSHPRDVGRTLDPISDRDLIRARIEAASQIVRIEAAPDGRLVRLDPVLTLKGAIAAQPDLQPFAGKRLDENGLTIEGIAVRGDRLLAGFRGPALPDGRAAILSASLAGLLGHGEAESRLFKLPLGQGQGIRDLSPFQGGFLVLAGPVADQPGPYAIFAWNGASDDGVKLLLDLTPIARTGDKRKPEALLPLDVKGNKVRVLVLFDGASEGAPVVVEVPIHAG